MPLVCEFFGIKIYMYWADHLPMHFHAEYGNFKVLIAIEQAAVLKGVLPSKQLKFVLAWCEIHKDKLVENWRLAQAHEQISKIDPLR